MIKNLQVLLVLLFVTAGTKAENFIVTSNADKGPGTFRDAVIKASENGIGERDSIHFRLPVNESGRTITITTPTNDVGGNQWVPGLENVVIDGTTQPGEKLGISDAKVILAFSPSVDGSYSFGLLSNVSIFGICFKYVGSHTLASEAPLGIETHFNAGIWSTADNIQIGMPGKGNVFYNFLASLGFGGGSTSDTSDIVIQSNLFGIDFDGTYQGLTYTINSNGFQVPRIYPPVVLGGGDLYGKVKIGGSGPGEGNTFASGLFISDGVTWEAPEIYFGTDPGLKTTYEIIGNRFGVFADRDFSTQSKTVFFVRDLGEEDTVIIRSNVFGGNVRDNTCMQFKNLKAKVEIENNFIGVSSTGRNLGSENGISVINSPRIRVAENSIGQLGTAFSINNPGGIEISRNRIFCNTDVSPMYKPRIPALTVVAITGSTQSLISGTATPGSRVELFFADDCGTCNPETYIGETIAGANGRWSYSGNFTKDIIASATLNGATSEFTRPVIPVTINLNTKTIKNTCINTGEGSITGITIVNEDQYTYEWKQVGGDVAGLEKDLKNVFAGKYYLEIKRGNCAIVRTDTLEVLGYPRPVAQVSTPLITNVNCAGRKGSLKGIRTTNTLKYEWFKNTTSYAISTTTADIDSLEEGEYKLTVSNEGCSETFGPFKIEREQPATRPDFKVTKVYPCGNEKGRLSVNTANQTGYILKWTTKDEKEIGRDTVAGNLPSGKYKLYLSDPGGCVYLYDTYDLMSVTPLVLIDTDRKISPDSCSKSTGSIKGLIVSLGKGPYKYKWSDETGKPVSDQLDLTKTPAGTYRLEVSDSTACSAVSDPFTIDPIELFSPAPKLKNIQLCTTGPVMIKPENITTGTYKLYESETGPDAIEENTSGTFQLEAKASKTYYLTYANGSCESEKVPVKVTISSSDLKFPAMVSPNGDGINDTWKLQGIENYSNALVRIYNRFGGIVFQSVGYPAPFDGTSNGKPLPGGSYYYIIELSKDCKSVSGNLTIVR